VVNGLVVTDSSGRRYIFELQRVVEGKVHKGRAIGFSIRNHQNIDMGSGVWRYQCHPFDFGIGGERYGGGRTYTDGNIDATNRGYITAPPKVNTLSFPNATGCTKIVEFAGNIFFLCGRYVYRVNSSYTVTQDRDLGAGVTGTDMVVFNNQLIVACGSPSYMQARDTAGTWSVSSTVKADKLAVVNDRLWRTLSNQLFSCSTNPLSSASYIQSNNVGDTTYAVTALVEYGGIPWPIKENGAYQADTFEVFKNQTPQIAGWPNPINGRASFAAKGSLYMPTIGGLLEISRGTSRYVGPEITNKPVSGLITYAGLEWQGNIWLACKDNSGNSPYFVKMIEDKTGATQRRWIYHQMGYFGTPSSTPRCMGISTLPTNPTIFVGMETGTTVYYIKLGRGGGNDVSDSNYQYQNTFFIRTGLFQPVEDSSIESIFHGVDIVSSLGALDGLAVKVFTDTGEEVDLATDYEYVGEYIVRGTRPSQLTRLYAPPGTSGKLFELYIYGESDPNNVGNTRPEIREIYAFGFARPKRFELAEISVIASSYALVNGMRNALSFEETIALWLKWAEESEVLTVENPMFGYTGTFNAIVTNLQVIPNSETYLPNGVKLEATINVELARIEYGRQ
jgi:hypothetical protein